MAFDLELTPHDYKQKSCRLVSVRGMAVKNTMHAFWYVVPLDLNVLIPVASLMLMIDSQAMNNFMNDSALVHTVWPKMNFVHNTNFHFPNVRRTTAGMVSKVIILPCRV